MRGGGGGASAGYHPDPTHPPHAPQPRRLRPGPAALRPLRQPPQPQQAAPLRTSHPPLVTTARAPLTRPPATPPLHHSHHTRAPPHGPWFRQGRCGRNQQPQTRRGPLVSTLGGRRGGRGERQAQVTSGRVLNACAWSDVDHESPHLPTLSTAVATRRSEGGSGARASPGVAISGTRTVGGARVGSRAGHRTGMGMRVDRSTQRDGLCWCRREHCDRQWYLSWW